MVYNKKENTSNGGMEKTATQHAAPRGSQTKLSKNCNLLASPKPDNPGLDITGRYQEKNGRFTFHVNQAGKYIECWEADCLDAGDKNNKNYAKYGGVLKDTNTFSIYHIPEQKAPNPEEVVGELRRDSDTTLLLTWYVLRQEDEPQFNELILNQPYPVLSEGAFAYLSVWSNVSTELEKITLKFYEWAPLTRQQLNWLNENLAPEKINPLLESYMEFAGSQDHPIDSVKRLQAAKAIDDAIGMVFSTTPPDGWHQDDLPLATYFGRIILATNRWTYDNLITQSHLDWIQVIINRISNSKFFNGKTAKENTKNIQNYLKLKPSGVDEPERTIYKYRVEINVGALSGELIVGGGLYAGFIKITKESPDTKPEVNKFIISFGGISAGLSVGVDFFENMLLETESFNDWRSSFFPGWVSFHNAGGKVEAGPVGFGVNSTIMYLNGAGIHPQLTFTSADAGLGAGGGINVGANYEVSWGYIFPLGHHFDKVDVSSIVLKNDYVIDSKLNGQIHFHLDCSLLTEDARRAIRGFCARELASLMSQDSYLEIIGHTDRLASEEHNLKLSENRAKNTYQAIKDVLGDNFKILEEPVYQDQLIDKNEINIIQGKCYIIWAGEVEAKLAGEKDEIPNPLRRKVDILLNSRLVLTLRGEK